MGSEMCIRDRWETLLDIDALAKAEGRDWVFKGADCLAPDETRCLINLSDGGKDAVVVREFDTTTKTFLDDGFSLPEGKHRIEWLDRDTLLVATDFGAGTMTESGYPFIVKTLKRGQSLAQATEVYRGEQGDGGYGVSPAVYRNKDGQVTAVIITRPLDTFRSETWSVAHDGATTRLALPDRVSVFGAQGDLLIFSNDEAWRFRGIDYKPGSLLSMPLASLQAGDDVAISNQAAMIYEPAARQSLGAVRVLDRHVVAALSDNVAGRLAVFQNRGESGWSRQDVAIPENIAVGLGDSSKSKGEVFVSTQGFLTPPTLSLASILSLIHI